MEGLSDLLPGRAWPLGAQCEGGGVNFAVFSAHAEAVALCLFDERGESEVARVPLRSNGSDVWHAHLRNAGPGLIYGLRAHGPWQPEQGHRFDATKLLLDPYAREIVGTPASGLKARVVDAHYDWGDDSRLHIALADSVLYEAHVKGLTQLHPGVPEALRGSYAGLASDAAIAHLLRLGITAVSLLPVHQHLDERRLAALGLRNYWGYNTIGFFAVEPRYASGAGGLSARDEFRAMVKRLHAAGIEVILDVVFNHTAETDADGPTLSWRGLDNSSYYRSLAGHPGAYDNLTGCGNTLDLRHPRVLQLVLDSLRYWTGEMHVDGFRFDLAPVLGRGDDSFDPQAPFFRAIAQDPLLQGLKFIAEPWDVGPGGYQLGNFPPGWPEWNDRFRDGMRRFWLGGGASRGEFAQRLCASSDIFDRRGRQPEESVNFIVAHDGFTLRDLLCYEHKHNQANGENNRDGHGANHGWNCGVEGPTDDAQVLALRVRLQRALLATLLLAQGTPMLCAGDELGHSQGGNNNAYCQDNETSWIDWSRADEPLIEFTARAVALRRQLLPLGRHWVAPHELEWLRNDGHALRADEWSDGSQRVLGALIRAPGKAATALLLLVNAEARDCAFSLPAGPWRALLDTSAPTGTAAWQGGATYPLAAHSLALLAREEAA